MKTKKDIATKKRAGKKFANLDLHLMIAPAVIYFIIFAYLPLIGLIIAFKNYNYTDGVLFSPWCGFDNFKAVISDLKNVSFILPAIKGRHFLYVPSWGTYPQAAHFPNGIHAPEDT